MDLPFSCGLSLSGIEQPAWSKLAQEIDIAALISRSHYYYDWDYCWPTQWRLAGPNLAQEINIAALISRSHYYYDWDYCWPTQWRLAGPILAQEIDIAALISRSHYYYDWDYWWLPVSYIPYGNFFRNQIKILFRNVAVFNFVLSSNNFRGLSTNFFSPFSAGDVWPEYRIRTSYHHCIARPDGWTRVHCVAMETR